MCVHAFGFCLHRAAQIEEVNDVAFRVTEEREERKKKKESCSAAALALPAALFFPPFFPPPYVYYTSKYAPISTAETGCLSHHPAFHPPPLPHFPSFFFLFSTLCKTKIHGHQHVEPFRSKSRRFLSFLHL